MAGSKKEKAGGALLLHMSTGLCPQPPVRGRLNPSTEGYLADVGAVPRVAACALVAALSV